ncbi:MAG: sigma-70 family RNA polymerase sigma factor [Oscillospiraceae bacterium]|nr:sigma-70 family RNA polymerase sigma factor [Oscillospiraceae bacterium]MBQ9939643.1 sigma-70 family RNA polymerase sigma factor [Oscillospiraceae bacterium]
MEDREIVERYWQRDSDVIAVTAEKYGGFCMKISENIVGSSHTAEECVNDTWLAAWNSMPQNRPNNLKAYLGKIVRNISFNRYKRTNTLKRGGEIAVVLDELAECVSGREDVEQAVDENALICGINAFLAELPTDKREIFVRRYWYAESVKDIAKRCGISENNVSVTLNRLRKKLAEHLEREGFVL